MATSAVMLAVVLLVAVGSVRGGSIPGPAFSILKNASGYYEPFYPYSNDDILQVGVTGTSINNAYTCKYGAQMAGPNMEMSQLHLAPCTWIQTHVHATTFEINMMLKGALSYWIVLANGTTLNGTIPHGGLLYIPQGLTHVLLNPTCEITTNVHLFPLHWSPDFMWTQRYGIQDMPDEFFIDTYNMTKAEFPVASIPDKIHTVAQQCMKACGLPLNYYSQASAPNLCDFMKATNYTADPASYIPSQVGGVFGGGK